MPNNVGNTLLLVPGIHTEGPLEGEPLHEDLVAVLMYRERTDAHIHLNPDWAKDLFERLVPVHDVDAGRTAGGTNRNPYSFSARHMPGDGGFVALHFSTAWAEPNTVTRDAVAEEILARFGAIVKTWTVTDPYDMSVRTYTFLLVE